jgi:DNA repair exonuclease SbcCD nuclease subunit
MKKATFILTADIHLREDQPVCRTDDYGKAQEKAIDLLDTIQHDHSCPILIVGDLFDKWKPSPNLLTWSIKHLPNRLIEDTILVTPGQHDLPNHNIDLLPKSGLSTLEAAGTIKILRYGIHELKIRDIKINIHSYPFGSEIKPIDKHPRHEKRADRDIAITHYFTYQGKAWPGCKSPNAKTLLKKMKGYDLVVTGDNHQPFVIRDENRVLVNPGSMMRMKADQVNHKPRLYLYYAEDNTIEPVFFPIEEGVISRIQIEKEKEKDDRIKAFVSSIKNQGETRLNFRENLKTYFLNNRESRAVRNIIWRSLGDE